MAVAKKKKKKVTWFLSIFFSGCFVILITMVGGSSGGSVMTSEGEVQNRINQQTSRLDEYLNNHSVQQEALAKYALDEYSERTENSAKGGDKYIRAIDPELYDEKKESQTSNDKKENRPLDIKWDGYFIGYLMKMSGTDISDWSYILSVFATKLNNSNKLVLPDNYIPRKGDIVFFGKPLKNLSDGMTVKAKYCGVITNVEVITEKTEIQAMRITVIEGCVDPERVEGNLHLGLSYLKSYVYDLYENTENNHHGLSNETVPIMCYATVAEDAEKPESTDDPQNRVDLVYQIKLKSTYEAAKNRLQRSE